MDFLAEALLIKESSLTTGGPEAIPGKIEELRAYDCVVLSEVPPSSLAEGKMTLLARYVRDYGGGLVVLGGPGFLSYGGMPLENLLPVAPTKRRAPASDPTPRLGIILLIDKSGSMGMASGKKAGGLSGGIALRGKSSRKMEWVQKAAGELVKQLRPNDMVGIIAFDSAYTVPVPLGPAGEDRREIIGRIREIEAGGDTILSKSLEEALRQLKTSSCRMKHVILLTDGQTKDLKNYDYRGLISEYARNGVTVSTIGIGESSPGLGSNFLRAIALGTGGEYHQVKDLSALPSTVLRDTRAALEKGGVFADKIAPQRGDDGPLRREIGKAEIPEVRRYAVTSAKPGAEVVFHSDLGGGKDPLLAAWRRGAGRTVVWTPEIHGDRSDGTADAGEKGDFWRRVVGWAKRPQPGVR